jgi:putative protease
MSTEQTIGVVTGYYGKIGVAVVRLNEGAVAVGNRLRFHGATTEFTQRVESLQIEHQPVERAERGQEVAVKVRERVRRGDRVSRVPDDG